MKIDKKEMEIPYGKEEDKFGELRLPLGDGPFPVAVLIHGGFWRDPYKLEQMRPMADSLVDQGIATWNIEYRRVKQPGDGWPHTFLDSAKAVDYIQTLAQEYPLDTSNVITIGHSAGGHLALWLAGRDKLPKESI